MKKYFLILILETIILTSKGNDSIPQIEPLSYRHHFTAGCYFSNSYTNLRMDSRFFGIAFSLEKDFGYNENGNGFNAGYSFEISKRSSITASYFF